MSVHGSTDNPDTMAAAAAAVTGTQRVKRGMADMLKGGVIMDVVTPAQAKIAEDAGAVAVMALERVPADIMTAAMIPSIMSGSLIRATPPCTLMSAGTRTAGHRRRLHRRI